MLSSASSVLRLNRSDGKTASSAFLCDVCIKNGLEIVRVVLVSWGLAKLNTLLLIFSDKPNGRRQQKHSLRLSRDLQRNQRHPDQC